MACFIVDGDKGGTGKSFVTRALADFLITKKGSGRIVIMDCDPSNPDVVCANGFSSSETIGNIEVIGLAVPVNSQEDWFAAIDAASGASIPGTDFVFSLPAGAGLYIDDTVLNLMGLIAPVSTVWVMGKDESSIDQLNARLARAPSFYEHGLIALNEYHGSAARGTFSDWKNSQAYMHTVEQGEWREVLVNVLNAFVTRQIGTMPLHRAHALSKDGKLSPTIAVGVEAFRRAFGAQLETALEYGNVRH